MRAVFMGTPDFAVPTLEALIGAHEVLAVVTQPDRRRGRGKAIVYSPVKEKALEHHIPVLQPEKVKEEAFIEKLAGLKPDVIVVAAFGQILPEAILDMPKYGCVNVHASLLPGYRGAAPIQWAIINGEKETGITIMFMDKGLDTGDMLGQTVVAIDPGETGQTLHDKLAAAGGPILLDCLRQLEEGTCVRRKQDHSRSSYAKMLTKELGRIDWTMDALSIERLIRGLNSWPSAYTFYKGKSLKLWAADVDMERKPEADPGTVTGTGRDSIDIACGRGVLMVRELQLQGKKRMSAHDFLLGNPLETGMVFGK